MSWHARTTLRFLQVLMWWIGLTQLTYPRWVVRFSLVGDVDHFTVLSDTLTLVASWNGRVGMR